MKILFTLLLLVPSFAQAAQTWKSEEKKIVYFAPDLNVLVDYQELKASEEFWGQVTVSLKYDYDYTREQFETLRAENPGYSVQRVIVGKAADMEITVPSLNLREAVTTLQDTEGPHFHWVKYLNRKESAVVAKASKDLSTFVQVQGKMRVTLPVDKVVERVSIPRSICSKFSKYGNDVYAMVLAYPEMEKEIDAAAKEIPNRDSLKAMVLKNCLDVDRNRRVYSFADLLSIPLRDKGGAGDFQVELKRSVREESQVPVGYRVGKGQ